MFSKSSNSLSASSTETNKIPAVKYIFDIVDFRNGSIEPITEVFIPSANIIFNKVDAFKADKPRTSSEHPSTKDILIPKTIVDLLIKQAELNSQLTANKKELAANNEYKNICMSELELRRESINSIMSQLGRN